MNAIVSGERYEGVERQSNTNDEGLSIRPNGKRKDYKIKRKKGSVLPFSVVFIVMF